ncbi:MAG: RelA/SpoT family protein [Bacteroidia bacterium]|nr:RelA/SpoT family protein [Bacteroidia bacterium]MDW8332878.1 RelA/SpoT family protein [Bacteroidia bacterium]
MSATQTTQAKRDARLIASAFRALMRECESFINDEERERVQKAFEFGKQAHDQMRRKTGEPYILHPIAVARIVVKEIGLKDATAVVAALVHDVVEDTDYTVKDIQAMFGRTVAQITDGLTKISYGVTPGSSMQAETFRKMLLTMSSDIRVALIKIADRLHNMRTLKSMNPESRLKVSAETGFLYAPLAHRLGLYNIKTELEDLALLYTDPEAYHEIARKVRATGPARGRYIQNFIAPLKAMLESHGLPCEIIGRVKSISSIYQKMKRQAIPFEQVYDLFAVRVILDVPESQEYEACWKAYRLIDTVYQNHPNRMRDWLTRPRPNGYEALHTTVTGPGGRWVEVQIRSRRMDYNAEKGPAAHWRYKDNGATPADKKFEDWLAKIRSALENKDIDVREFFAEVKNDIVTEHIHVFTPKGELKMLPPGATVLDLAYEIHTGIGHTAIGGKVNYEAVGLNHVLRNGDRVEIITSKTQKPDVSWLEFVKTSKARERIKEATREQRKAYEEKGRKFFEESLKRYGVRPEDSVVEELLHFLDMDRAELYQRLGMHRIDLKRINEFIKTKRAELAGVSPAVGVQRTLDGEDPAEGMLIFDGRESAFRLAACCGPIPGDDLMGFRDPNLGVVVHRSVCPKLRSLLAMDGKKAVKVRWNDKRRQTFLASIKIEGYDRFGILINIVRVVTVRFKINIRSITIDGVGGVFDGLLKVYVFDAIELENLMEELRKIDGVVKVYRTEG